MMPINLNNSHWGLLVVDEKGKAFWLDSLNRSPPTIVPYRAFLVHLDFGPDPVDRVDERYQKEI